MKNTNGDATITRSWELPVTRELANFLLELSGHTRLNNASVTNVLDIQTQDIRDGWFANYSQTKHPLMYGPIGD